MDQKTQSFVFFGPGPFLAIFSVFGLRDRDRDLFFWPRFSVLFFWPSFFWTGEESREDVYNWGDRLGLRSVVRRRAPHLPGGHLALCCVLFCSLAFSCVLLRVLALSCVLLCSLVFCCVLSCCVMLSCVFWC